MENPYSDIKLNNCEFYRNFDYRISPDELVWHRDHCNRKIEVVEGQQWYLQMDNELPVLLEPRKEYHIPKNSYHRIIKGSGNLVLKITEQR